MLARNATGAISKGARVAWLVCGFLGIASALLVSLRTIASPNSIGSNAAQSPRIQTDGTAYPGMAWIPGGTFLMGTDDKASFPNERPAHFVQVQGVWIDENDVTNAEFAKVVGATGYVTTAERPVHGEDLKKELASGTPKPDEKALAPRSLVFTPTWGPLPITDLSVSWRWMPGGQLAPSRKPRKLYPEKRKLSSCSGLVIRSDSLGSMGVNQERKDSPAR